MIETIEQIIRTNDLAVLATCTDNKPHSSLMAYVPHEDCRTLYMLTQRESRKFRNMSANPWVSVMIDTRMDNPHQRSRIRALTLSAKSRPARNARQEALKNLLLARHPQLKDLAGQEGSLVMEIISQSFLLLDGVNNAFFVDISRP